VVGVEVVFSSRSPRDITLIRPIMSPTGSSQLTERLPLELLEKVLAYTSIPDILRMKQVRRLYDRVQRFQLNLQTSSPFPGHSWFLRFHPEIALHQAPNRSLCCRVGGQPQRESFPCRQTQSLRRIPRKWDAFHPIKKWEREVDSFYPDCQVSGSGVYGFVAGSRNSSSSSAWSRFHEGCRPKSGRSHCLTSSS
jgi:hypothetical protein